MYVARLRLRSIRSIEQFELTLPDDRLPGWHVLLGDNGAGKSTFVRALALALVGRSEAKALRQDWSNWLRSGADEGHIELGLRREAAVDELPRKSVAPSHDIKEVVKFRRLSGGRGPTAELIDSDKLNFSKSDLAYLGRARGWFSASFGPYRRFTGGSLDYERLFQTNPRLAPHLSAFGEDVALTECLRWLQTLHVRGLEQAAEPEFLGDLVRFVNEGGLLPHQARIHAITSEAVTFIDGNGCIVPVEQLSDGYRSILSLTFELIRQMVASYGADAVFRRVREGTMAIDLPGVVAIDEIDAHLHPSWQRRIGPWFMTYFPRLQFFVTTHSPIICQAAEHGTVWRLPTPGSDQPGGRVEGEDLRRLIFGNLLEAFDTALFGTLVTRSDSSKEMLKQLALLNRKALEGKLSASERRQLDELRSTLPTTASVAQRANLPVE